MKPVDLAAIAVIAVFVVFAIWYAAKHKDCSGNCKNCQATCPHNKGEEPDFVRRYRKDHPKNKK